MQTLPLTRELVLIGGGHTHALVLRRWGMKPVPGVRLTVIDPNPTAPYTGMLPGHIAGHYDRDALEIDLVRLARFAGERLILGAATGIDRNARRIHVAGRPPIPFDIASIDIGIGSAPPALPGFAEHGVAAKPLGPYAEAWAAFCARVADGVAPDIAVIGAGVGGVELAIAIAHALQNQRKTPQITVFDSAKALPGLHSRARGKLLQELTRHGIILREETGITEVTATEVRLADGSTVASQFTLGATGAQPQGWLSETGLDLTDGFITVGPTLQSSDPQIYAAGDCAHLSHAPRPKAGVYAVRAAPVLYDNLRAALTGQNRQRPFRPQGDYLKLVSLGRRSALMEKWGIALASPVLWRWKDGIDRKFMRKFHELPEMPQPALPRTHAEGMAEALGDKPACGGCGAKIGGGTLGRVLASLPSAHRKDVETRPGDDAAVLNLNGTRQVVTTDHLRAFTEDPWLQARIAAVHAMGDIWAMGAEPQAALAQVILPRMAPPMQEAWLAEIMAAAADVFGAAGAEIVGGHSSLGTELTVGFTVTGLCHRPPITIGGAQPGDTLILTKPIGSGTLLAGEMQGKASGRDVMAALALMAEPQGQAAEILSTAHAMTDVTGFGLAGHLQAICEASGVAAELSLAAVPTMTGAEALAAGGIRSTIYPENRALAARITVAESAKAALLFDPQTAGGLLAAVPPQEADRLLFQLQDRGIPAARIGAITDGAPFVTVT
nr:selenide, water dikinase SelD [Pseudoruegeria sp. HB172150]